MSPALAGGLFTTEPPERPLQYFKKYSLNSVRVLQFLKKKMYKAISFSPRKFFKIKIPESKRDSQDARKIKNMCIY